MFMALTLSLPQIPAWDSDEFRRVLPVGILVCVLAMLVQAFSLSLSCWITNMFRRPPVGDQLQHAPYFFKSLGVVIITWLTQAFVFSVAYILLMAFVQPKITVAPWSIEVADAQKTLFAAILGGSLLVNVLVAVTAIVTILPTSLVRGIWYALLHYLVFVGVLAIVYASLPSILHRVPFK